MNVNTHPVPLPDGTPHATAQWTGTRHRHGRLLGTIAATCLAITLATGLSLGAATVQGTTDGSAPTVTNAQFDDAIGADGTVLTV